MSHTKLGERAVVKSASKVSNTKPKFDFWNSRQGNAVAAFVAVLATYALASRAIETGSLQQYFLTFLFLGLAINRLIRVIRK